MGGSKKTAAKAITRSGKKSAAPTAAAAAAPKRARADDFFEEEEEEEEERRPSPKRSRKGRAHPPDEEDDDDAPATMTVGDIRSLLQAQQESSRLITEMRQQMQSGALIHAAQTAAESYAANMVVPVEGDAALAARQSFPKDVFTFSHAAYQLLSQPEPDIERVKELTSKVVRTAGAYLGGIMVAEGTADKGMRYAIPDRYYVNIRPSAVKPREPGWKPQQVIEIDSKHSAHALATETAMRSTAAKADGGAGGGTSRSWSAGKGGGSWKPNGKGGGKGKQQPQQQPAGYDSKSKSFIA